MSQAKPFVSTEIALSQGNETNVKTPRDEPNWNNVFSMPTNFAMQGEGDHPRRIGVVSPPIYSKHPTSIRQRTPRDLNI